MTVVLLIRHGRTAANRAGVLAGRTPGVGLDGEGRRQVAALARRLRRVPLTVIVHSPLERCVETAHALAVAQPVPPPMEADDRLIECDYGAWTGRPLAELSADPLWRRVQCEPAGVRFPGGESLSEMAQRAVAAVADWSGRHGDGVVALVSHADLIMAVLSSALAQPLDEFQRIVVSPGSVSVLAVGADRTAVLGMNLLGGRPPVAPAPGARSVRGGS